MQTERQIFRINFLNVRESTVIGFQRSEPRENWNYYNFITRMWSRFGSLNRRCWYHVFVNVRKVVDKLKYQCDVSPKSLISCHEFIKLILVFKGGSLLHYNDIMKAIWVYNCHLMMSIQKTFFIKIWKTWMFYHIAIIFLSYKHTE